MQLIKHEPKNVIADIKPETSPVDVLTKYSPLVKSRAIYYSTKESELDDLIQEGTIGLLLATSKYDNRISAFATFARKCIDSAIIDYLRKMRKMTTVPMEMLVDISDVDVVDAKFDLEYFVSLKEEYKCFLENAKEELSAFEHSVFVDMLHGFSQTEICERKGVNIKSIRNAVQRIRSKLK